MFHLVGGHGEFMRILVIGSGGREHALVWKITQSPRVEKIYCIPGNVGIAKIAECHNIAVEDFKAIAEFVRKEKIDLTVVGPEVPLVGGIVDYFNNEGLKIFGPTSKASKLEGSKVFAKELMRKYGVPTANFEIFDDSTKAIEYIEKKGAPIIVKADGLAAGKGVIVAKTVEEAIAAVKEILENKIFKEAGNKIIIEDYLKGEEVSILAFVDQTTFIPLISSQDHKRVYDGDRGPNTGGMGAYAPVPLINEEVQKRINEEIFVRLIGGLRAEGIKYNGILYAGLMIENGKPNVLEFNVRFGDPETQAILPLLETDLVDAIISTTENKLNNLELKWRKSCAVCVVLASAGYPGTYEKGKEIKGLEKFEKSDDIIIFHAGTSLKNGKIVTSGGRVLDVTAVGNDIKNARDKVYDAITNIYFDGMHYRKDIGKRSEDAFKKT